MAKNSWKLLKKVVQEIISEIEKKSRKISLNLFPAL